MRGKRWNTAIEFHKESSLSKKNGIVHRLKGVLDAFASKEKTNVTLHFPEGPGFAPFPKRKNQVHFVVGAAPPGDIETEKTYRSHACGIQLHKECHYIRISGPTRGYGVMVKDGEDVHAQIVDSTIYLYIPSPEQSDHVFKSSDDTKKLYTKAIQLAWKTYTGKRKQTESKELTDVTYKKFRTEQKKLLLNVFQAKLEGMDEDIAKCLEKLRGLYNEKQVYTQLVAIEEKRPERPDLSSVEDEWRRMSSKKLVKRLMWVDGALQVETRDIIVTHKKKSFIYGRFVMRMPSGGTPSLWAIESRHPKRIAHPHISKNGIACFGNISASLMQAAGESRLDDELDLLLSWLVDGYDPSITDIKIEEWPQVKAKSSQKRSVR